ncbi:Hek2p KNAG_0H00920 [Huiozyma naganishii CBS 8797]|uniref:K Homology domain-containing protein n=1 Tax=Huiozyma naganishii (strain ATCC MYA-139 / BCRC 22969 / CBS 8797 / KCTC 17520 / NBRC 10181 / NCYC 3082 / Yp74L-3) TaxID=1071383 RepID=J7S1L9_HUIN7|nr:hypothetical protein KNAG_0H00920 [Kazachstania naganishii CBS 8797]CCK71507.1 hypothetical protein KNAG_0H00920 [Kazachstania naganishii CBS 8797]
MSDLSSTDTSSYIQYSTDNSNPSAAPVVGSSPSHNGDEGSFIPFAANHVVQPMTTQQPMVTQQPTISHRVLLSLSEAAKIIGTKGSKIAKIRTENNVKIGISEKIMGCSDRILSCAGTVFNVANALGDVVDDLNEPDEFDEQGNALPNNDYAKKYPFHFLNHILPPPSSDEIKDPKELANIGTLRLIIINSHLSSIIGKGGATIKGLIEKHGVKIVASKDFLPDSNERVLEIQGFPSAITNTLIEISDILINDVDLTFNTEKRYFPHLKRPAENPAGANAGSFDYENANQSTQAVVLIPESYVGVMVGRQGNRIANLRKFTRTKIIIEKNDFAESDMPHRVVDANGEPCRKFTIMGHIPKQVKLAESMLLKNLSTEIERRSLRNAEAQHETQQNMENSPDFEMDSDN